MSRQNSFASFRGMLEFGNLFHATKTVEGDESYNLLGKVVLNCWVQGIRQRWAACASFLDLPLELHYLIIIFQSQNISIQTLGSFMRRYYRN